MDREVCYLQKCKTLKVKGGMEGIAKVQDWAFSELKLKKKPDYKAIMKILKEEEKVVCRF